MKKRYGILHKPTGKLLYCNYYANYPIIEYWLETTSVNNTIWVTDSLEIAQKVIETPNIPYYNAKYNTPKHGFKKEELEVVLLNDVSYTKIYTSEKEEGYVNQLTDLKDKLEENMNYLLSNIDKIPDFYKEGKGTMTISYNGKIYSIVLGADIHKNLIDVLQEELNDLK